MYILYYKDDEYYNSRIHIIGGSCNKATLESVKTEMIRQDELDSKKRHEFIGARDKIYQEFAEKCYKFLLRNIDKIFGYEDRLKNFIQYYGELASVEEFNKEFVDKFIWRGFNMFKNSEINKLIDMSKIDEPLPICPELPKILPSLSSEYTDNTLIIEEIRNFDL